MLFKERWVKLLSEKFEPRSMILLLRISQDGQEFCRRCNNFSLYLFWMLILFEALRDKIRQCQTRPDAKKRISSSATLIEYNSTYYVS